MAERRKRCQPVDERPGEEWRQIVDLPAGYEVSNFGRVRSWHVGGTVGRLKTEPHLLRSRVNPHRGGYVNVSFSIGHKRMRASYVHHLVLEAFVGPCPEHCSLTRHLDRDPTNNRVDNLAWGTCRENELDAVRHGTHTRGEQNGQAKLTMEQVREIRASGASGTDLAARYHVAQSTLSLARRGLRYV